MESPTLISLRREPSALVRSLTALLLRVGLGMMFLTAGLTKLQGVRAGKYPGSAFDAFGDRIVFPGDVALFARVLPYAEIAVGAGLILGLLTVLWAFLSGVLLLVLFFGHIYVQKIEMFPAMLTYLLVNAGILWLSPVTSNYLSLDGLIFGWFWAPKGEGTYRRDSGPI